MMEKPTWVKVVGILGIIFGVTGLFGGMQTTMMPTVMDFQQRMLESIQDQAGSDRPPPEFFEIFKEFWDMPDWFRTWLVIYGIVGLLVGGYYLLAAIFFISVKRNCLKMMYWALALSMGITVIGIVVGLFAGTIMAFMAFARIWSLVIDVVLLIVIVVNDKTIFQRDDATAPIVA